jgi:hypothetical protein
MNRREFIALGAAAVSWPLAGSTQQAGGPVVGLLHAGSPRPYKQQVAAFLQGLSDAGFVEADAPGQVHEQAVGSRN